MNLLFELLAVGQKPTN